MLFTLVARTHGCIDVATRSDVDRVEIDAHSIREVAGYLAKIGERHAR